MKKVVIIVISIIVLIITINLIIGSNKTNQLNADRYKEILLQLGYGEDEIYDRNVEQDGLKRWVGLSNMKELYACVFEYTSNGAAEDKKQQSESLFSKKDFYYTKIEGNILLIIAADEEHRDEANRIIEKIEEK